LPDQSTVRFIPDGKRVEINNGSSVLDAALKAKIDISSLCGGRGYCGKCQVIVVENPQHLSPMTDDERKHLDLEKVDAGYRIACKAKVNGDIAIKIPEQSRTGKQKLVIMGIEPEVVLKPPIVKIYLELTKPTIHDRIADDIRLVNALNIKGTPAKFLDYDVALKLPDVARDGDWKLTATVRHTGEVIDVESGDTSQENYGFAVDIGTTKVAGFLIDLNTGTLLRAKGIMNPQIPFGEDLMTRISQVAKNKDNIAKIHEVTIQGIYGLMKQICDLTNINCSKISEMVIVGNTAMHHFFLGVNPFHVGMAPYPPAVAKSMDLKTTKLGINIRNGAYVHLLPNVAGFVGADAVADVLATEIYTTDKLTLLIDVGTNTEVMLGNKKRIVSCSTASGPAFEGAHIKFGMRASTGAIERVKIDPELFQVTYKTIDAGKPRGICGSGIIDALAEMLKAGLMDTGGKLRADGKGIRSSDLGLEYVLANKEETPNMQDDITITQQDIREIQKAKSAIHTGCTILMQKLGVATKDIEKLVIAGAFGLYIDPLNVMTIGMIPEVPIDRISFAGNTAGSGARLALKNIDLRESAESLASKIEYVELAAEPTFQEEYLNSMGMPHSDYSLFPETMNSIRAPRTAKVYRKGK